MRIFFLIFNLLLFQQSLASSVGEIPQGFHGRWANNQEQCKDEFPVFVIEITANSIEGWETHSKVTKVVKEVNKITLNLDMQFEGNQWDVVEVLVLSKDKQHLKIINKDGTFHNVRCK
jgi:hypothetical protein